MQQTSAGRAQVTFNVVQEGYPPVHRAQTSNYGERPVANAFSSRNHFHGGLQLRAFEASSLRNVNLAEELAGWAVTANAVLVRIAPADGAPDIAVGVRSHTVSNTRFGHLGKNLAV
jgi:hypothetical protein